MKIMTAIASLTIKDSLIVLSLIVLFFSVLRIRKLKKKVIQETKKRLFPQLSLELIVVQDVDKSGLFIKNEGLFSARNLEIDDLKVTLEDYGFKQSFILKFEALNSLGPKETAKLKFKVYDKQQDYLERVTETILPHLVAASFNLKAHYSNIESLKVYVEFIKQDAKFFTEEIDLKNTLR